jgi:hypothetical protein
VYIPAKIDIFPRHQSPVHISCIVFELIITANTPSILLPRESGTVSGIGTPEVFDHPETDPLLVPSRLSRV